MNLLDVTHFVCSNSINDCVQFLLCKFHNGVLWLDKSYQVDEELMHRVTGLSLEGEDSTVIL